MEKLLIETNRLVIRNLKTTDLADFHFYRSNPEVTKYQGFDVFSMEQTREFIHGQLNKDFGKAGEWVQYGIIDKQSGKLIGDCAIKLDQLDVRNAEIGITISHAEQKKGFGKETLIAILNFLFNSENFHRVTEIVDAENIASVKMLQSVGFNQEDHFIENVFSKGKRGSEYQYAMLRKDWEELKRRNNAEFPQTKI